MVSETIRWQTPLAHMRRTRPRTIELGGKTIKKGDKVVMWYVSGNRDDEVIENPNAYIIDRERPRQHLSFGFGIHRCVGNRLAELQLRVIWEEILARFPDIQVVGGVLKMVIAEAHNFPELSRIWYRELLGPILEVITAAIIRAQAEGEVRQGDPHAFALQAIAPLITLLIWRETFVPAGAPEHDVEAVLAQGVEAFLGGVLISQPAAAPAGWEPCGLAGD
jgi:hypothetical protein